MNTTLNLHIENLESLKGQLAYIENALDSNLELWERKEFSIGKAECINDILFLEGHIEMCKNL